MKTKLIFSVIGMSLMGLLSGCAGLNSSFDCPMKPGVMCKSLDQVDTMVDQGKLGRSPDTTLSANETKTMPLVVAANTETSDEPSRTDDKVARIWIAPYEDNEGDYYGATTVYHVVKPSEWSDNPVKMADAEGGTF